MTAFFHCKKFSISIDVELRDRSAEIGSAIPEFIAGESIYADIQFHAS
jgi:hypothetical protein